MKRVIKKLLRSAGYKIVALEEPTSIRELNPDITDQEWETFNSVEEYTMTSLERILTAIRAAAYISENHVPGDIVECGVWRGGSTMAMARTLFERGDLSRRLYLYDTFDGMVQPTGSDIDHRNREAAAVLSEIQQSGEKWCYASLDDVRANLAKTQYPVERIVFVKGPVEKTIPDTVPEAIALLRLDTDWYESTRHELIHLYPRLSQGGILIVDDYGHWRGSRQAVDECLGGKLYLNRIDYSGRLGIKP